MNNEDKIKDLQYQIEKIDGRTTLCNVGNRVYGAGLLTIASVCIYASPWSLPLAVPVAVEGLCDLATGKHHFASYRLLKIHPKYELEKILNNEKKLSGEI